MNLSTALEQSPLCPPPIATEQGGRDHEMMDAGRMAILALLRHTHVSDQALSNLRQLGIGNRGLSRDEADALFALERADVSKTPDWDGFFISAITDYCVWDLRPTGVVNESQGEWLLQAADRCATSNALAVLENVQSVAHRVPMWFTAATKARIVRGWPAASQAACA